METLYCLGNPGYAVPFQHLVDKVVTINYYNEKSGYPVDKTKKCKVLLFTGGEDINPKLYGEKSKFDQAYNDKRDSWEKAWWDWAIKNRVPIIGICRGLQFMNIMCGGKLIQHVGGHQVGHQVRDERGPFFVSSIHHQMCIVPNMGEEVLAVTEDDQKLPEAVFYPSVNALGVQWHPECLNATEYANVWLMQQLKRYMGLW